ncbi:MULTISPECIES: hypothetical protein [Photorhabdus]|uniref:Lipoprotein n=2 Tax=Photorhabdus asymbiotica TaxID=291112 RepID=C7BKA4_PHOAA|nr:hypothetical protein [Photorhabdus asymbiotica]RKS59458.1 hypothetical protein BDD30_1531 [Photorhabdus asymbiotica]CAQ85601.1 conserved hypothetical Protein [Photorhabdus asymbiotica]
MTSKLYPTILIPFFFALTACDLIKDLDDEAGKFYFSNSGNTPLQFKIDDQSFNLKEDEIGIVDLKVGEHVMETADGQQTPFMVYPNNKGGIINPNKDMYYTYSMVYATNENSANHFSPPINQVVINGEVYEGPIHSTNAVFIDNNFFRCTYPIGTPFPDEIKSWDKKSVGSIETKCFNKKEFLTFYHNEAGEPINPQATINVAANSDSITDYFGNSVPSADFENPDLQAKAQKIVALLQQFVQSKDANVQKDFQKQYHELIIDLIQVSSKAAVHQTKEENEKYNHFSQQSGNVIGAGIMARP